MIKRNQFENYAIRLLKRIFTKYLKYIGGEHEHIYLSCSIVKNESNQYCININNEYWEGGKDQGCPVDRYVWEDVNE